MKRLFLIGLLISLLASACGTLEISLDGTATSAAPTTVPAPTVTVTPTFVLPPPPTPAVPADAVPYHNADLGFSLLLPAGWTVFGPMEATQQGFAFYALGPQAGAEGGPDVSQIIVADGALTPEQFLLSYCSACPLHAFEAVIADGVMGIRTTLGGETTPEIPWTFFTHNGKLLGFSLRPLGGEDFQWMLGTIKFETPTASATPTPATSLGFACPLAYASGSLVYCLGEGGTPVLIADHSTDGTVSDPLISDDGAWVAYLVNYIGGTSQLWGINVSTLTGNDGLNLPREIMADPSQFTTGGPDVAISPLRPQWQPGTHKIFFSTRYTNLNGEQDPGEHLIGDLWSVDADNNGLFNLMPRQSVGTFQFSPDGQHIAIATSQSILLMKPDVSDLRVVLEFPFINTASEYTFKPVVVWSPDSAFFSVAIPSAEPLAADAHADLYRISVDGTAQKQLTVMGNFVFGIQIPLTISPDGRYVVYGNVTLSSPETETQSGDIHLLSVETQADTVLATNGVWTDLGWSPDSGRYAYAAFPAGNGFVAETNGAIQPFGMADTQLTNAAWVDATSFYFIGVLNGQAGIFFQRLGEPAQTIGTGFVNYAALDVR